MSKSIALFCSARSVVDQVYHQAAVDFAQLVAQRGDVLVFGGGTVGLMGTAARAAQAEGGRVVGVMPQALARQEIMYAPADEMIVTADMAERKSVIVERADAFVALAGGFGTLDEILEVITLKQLNYHQKPIVLINTAGFYTPLLRVFDRLFAERFAEPRSGLYHVIDDVQAVYTYL